MPSPALFSSWSVVKNKTATGLYMVSLFALLLLIFSIVVARLNQKEWETVHSALHDHVTAYLQLQQEQQLIAQYLPLFAAYTERFAYHNNLRLEWVNLLEDIAGEIDTQSLHYQIEPQQPLSDAIGAFLYQNTMSLQSGLLHEGDFMHLLRRITGFSAALPTLGSCELRSAMPDATPQRSQNNLHMQCQLRWISIRNG